MAFRSVHAFKLIATASVVVAVSAAYSPADARSKRKRAPSYSPPYAAMVVDANSGRVLHAVNENALRHPASITKVMTLYMLFEQLERGRLRLDSEIPISSHAASMPPTKMGLRPGSTITVDNAIKSLVTKSANDIAAAIAEHLGGSEDAFAQIMTRKAHSLGMTRTNFANASGLPDPDQVTTARDLTILGRAIQERFPRYYGYFSTHAFQYGRATIRNHNKLLGRIEGVDGIKTGYTRASGFNLLTSAKRDGRRIVAVVLGGRSGGHRDQIMASLVEDNIDRGSRTRTATMVAEAPAVEERPVVADAPAPRPVAVAAVAPEPVRAEPPGKPLALASYAPTDVRPAVVSGARADAAATASIRTSTPAVIDGSTRSTVEAATATPSTLRWVSGPRGVVTGMAPRSAQALNPPAPIPAAPAAAPAVAEQTRVTRVAMREEEPAKPAAAPAVREGRPASARSGVMIQVGATDDQEKAEDLLARARSHGRSLLASAKPFTEKVQKGRETLWRARFAGLDADGAESACRALKKSGIACFTTRN
ncbi:MAG TPA: serine hydrolase [Beijerinckiaceae bacterium]